MAEDARAKNAKAIKKQEKVEAKKAVAPVEIDETTAVNKLSKRNEDYLFKLRKELVLKGKTEAEAQAMSDELVVEIYENQIKGIPATKLYGTPTLKADSLINPTKEPVKHPFWKIATDTSLLFFVIFGALYGVLGMTGTNDKQGQTGIITLITIAVLWGVLLSWFNIQTKLDRGQRPGLLKTLIYMATGLAIMVGVLFITTSLPTFVNPVLPGTVYLVIAIVAFIARYIFRKTNNITGSSFI
ncbi:membrane protein [Companilactobacillus sp. RD055328]|uniref:DUF1129 family protein n=1 Tax=Companilactobacillus sp. RD055328 TaxID=2916634 RepID=UPI001FC7D429|nr:DUF1129 family protein [Companilactobacillus sp. RD055328]GKQ43465.1 membrane protein [Companilactobacillus sp. RD055328]